MCNLSKNKEREEAGASDEGYTLRACWSGSSVSVLPLSELEEREVEGAETDIELEDDTPRGQI